MNHLYMSGFQEQYEKVGWGKKKGQRKLFPQEAVCGVRCGSVGGKGQHCPLAGEASRSRAVEWHGPWASWQGTILQTSQESCECQALSISWDGHLYIQSLSDLLFHIRAFCSKVKWDGILLAALTTAFSLIAGVRTYSCTSKDTHFMWNILHIACVTINAEETTETELMRICLNIQTLRLRIPGFPHADWHFHRLAWLRLHPSPPRPCVRRGTYRCTVTQGSTVLTPIDRRRIRGIE